MPASLLMAVLRGVITLLLAARRRIDLTDRGLATHTHHHEGSWIAN